MAHNVIQSNPFRAEYLQETATYARVSTYRTPPENLAELEQLIDPIAKQLRQINGVVSCQIMWDEVGNGVTVAVYEDKDKADAGADQIKAIWGSVGGLLASPPEIKAYDRVEIIDMEK